MKPGNDEHTAEKLLQNNQKKESESNRFKINSKSKNGESMVVMKYANDTHFGLVCLHCIN